MSANIVRLISWNINGIRASLKKNTWPEIVKLNPDIFSVQEIKATNEFMDSGEPQHQGYSMAYEYATMKKGYSGVATYTKDSVFSHSHSSDTLFAQSAAIETEKSDTVKINSKNSENSEKNEQRFEVTQIINGLGDPKFDEEGRLLTHLFESKDGTTKIAYINGYYPQGGRGPHRVEYKIEFYKLVFDTCQSYRKQGYGVILCGDFNTTITDIDLARPKENRTTTGCLPEEREAFDWFLKNGYVDTFRHFYPDKPDMYSYWDQITRARERNVGWRIDYFLVSEDLIGRVKDAYIWMDVFGSDHCPVGIDIEL
jgi:exodeoxyribonuclease III